MFCNKCGAQNNDTDMFCSNCGNPLREQVVTASNNEQINISQQVQSTMRAPRKKIEMNKKTMMILLAAGVAFICLLVVMAIAIGSSNTINLNKYLEVNESGYDGYGSVKYTIDWNSIEEKYGKKVKYTKSAKKEYGDWLALMEPMELLETSISISFDNNRNLSNGDSVNYTWNIDEEELSKYIKFKIKYKDGKKDIKELQEISKFNPFDNVEVTFSGISPSGNVNVAYYGDEFSSYDFSIDKSYNVSNGEEITVSLNMGDVSYYAERYGKVPDTFEKNYTVDGLDEYVLTYNSISESFITQLVSEAEDSIYAYVASSYNKESKLDGLKYSGYVMLSVKDTSSWYQMNYLYIICSGMVSNSDGKFETTEVFFPVKFNNILKSGDSYSYESNSGICGSSNFGSSWYGTKGYTNPISGYSEIVEANRDSYNVECGGGFELYSSYQQIEKLSDISEGLKRELEAKAIDKIASYIASKYDSRYVTSNLESVGEYLLVAKSQGNSFEKNNSFITVFKCNVIDEKNRIEPFSVYFPVAYNGIIKLTNGEYIISETKGILGRSNIPNTYSSTDGFVNGENMFRDVVTVNRDKYTYEVSEGLKPLGQ